MRRTTTCIIRVAFTNPCLLTQQLTEKHCIAYGNSTIWQPVVVLSASTPLLTFLYSNLPPAHDIGEKWNWPGPQTLADIVVELIDSVIGICSPSTAGLHSHCGLLAASVYEAVQTSVCGPHLDLATSLPSAVATTRNAKKTRCIVAKKCKDSTIANW